MQSFCWLRNSNHSWISKSGSHMFKKNNLPTPLNQWFVKGLRDNVMYRYITWFSSVRYISTWIVHAISVKVLVIGSIESCQRELPVQSVTAISSKWQRLLGNKGNVSLISLYLAFEPKLMKCCWWQTLSALFYIYIYEFKVFSCIWCIIE